MTKLLDKLRTASGGLWWYTILLFIASRLGEVVNFYIGTFLVPRTLSPNELGALMPLMSVGSFVGLPIAILLIPVGKFLSTFAARGEMGKVKSLLRDAFLANAVFAIAVSVWLMHSGDAILERMHVTDRRILFPVAAFAILSCLEPIISSAQKALKCFRSVVVSSFGGPYVRLAGMLLLLVPFGAFGYLSAQLILALWGVGCALFALVAVLRRCGPRASYREDVMDMVRYSIPLLALTFAGRVQAPVETFVLRHRLPDDVTAGYYFSTMFGAIPGYATGALMAFLWPIVSDKFEKGESTRRILAHSMLFTLGVGALALLATAIAVPYVFRLPGPWANYTGYAKFVLPAGVITLLKSVQATFTSHESACRRFVYVRYMVPLMLLEAAVLYGLPALYEGMPQAPAFMVDFARAHWRNTLPMFLGTTILFNALFTLAMLIDWRLSMRGGASE